ncbi:hypothetical protein MUG84_15695 [Paenibacillus sp. KQZ6P-2]|uniref:Lipoprotein n=1 Tax=Paenibacillus mangrovi TaxID=2931978 RepID=A0A9X1WTA4_9BACL|nr:hypothetical protein [Paenibacillus mangrovi]MCJ8013175.1 hypothetical protein [Paenibacillus mangrovi]
MKRIISISVLLAMMLSLSACGGGDKSAEDQPPNSSSKTNLEQGTNSDNIEPSTNSNKNEETVASNKNNETNSGKKITDPMDLSQYYLSANLLLKKWIKAIFYGSRAA